jgi:signal transduction histidine kinase
MLKRLRRNLTLTFIFITFLIYATVVPVSVAIFSHGLTSSVDANLSRLLSEIEPSVEFVDGKASLAKWAESAREYHVRMLATVQLFDAQGNLMEAYGPRGIPKLLSGGLRADPRGRHRSLRSKYVNVDNTTYKLQVQVETNQVDEAVAQFIFTMFLVAPIMLAITGACGWFFAGKAVQPVARSVQVLRRFVADAAHELKTPATIIEASTQTLEEMRGELGGEQEIIDVLSRASQRLSKLAEDLVLLARMESPELSLEMQVFSLNELVAQIGEDFQELAKSKDIKLQIGDLPSAKIYGNADALSRVLINLVDNALRYTEPGGAVGVFLVQSDNNWVLTVEDTGIGIPRDALPYIFERFFRADASRARAIGGTGLGLSIVQAIVEAHGGHITVHSEESRGTRFVITLPSRMVQLSSQPTSQKQPEQLFGIKN